MERWRFTALGFDRFSAWGSAGHGRGLLNALASRIVVVLGAFVALAASAPAANAVDVYAFANGCYSLRDTTTNRVVVRDALGYATKVAGTAPTPFRLKATALGRSLL